LQFSQSKFFSILQTHPCSRQLCRYHLTGWEPEDCEFALCAANYKLHLESYRTLASELQINIVPGTIVEAHPSPSCPASCPSCPTTPSSSPLYLNVAYFISSTGIILGSYQKANLWHSERAHLSSISPTSSPHRVISTPLGPVGLLICWDIAFPEGFRALIAQGAKIIIIPAFWTGLGSPPEGLKRNPGFEKLTMQSVLMARAFENTAAIVFVNAGGVQEGNLGLSQVVMPFLGSVGAPLGHAEGMAIVDLDMEILEDAEQIYRVRQDMAGKTWPYKDEGISNKCT
jgi:predicted amidohydrolase